MVALNDVSVRFGGFELFNQISFMVNPKEKIGLVGKNGAGKTTLLKVILGEQTIESGTVSIPTEATIGYLPQMMEISDSKALFDETMSAFDDLIKVRKLVSDLTAEAEKRTDYDSDEYLQLLNRLSEASDRLNLLGEGNLEATIEQTLCGLGFMPSDFKRPTKEFSGGWRMRIELAKILLRKPDIILLDEPTNHLDIESIQWLENFLKDYNGAVILISHDRVFLDTVTTRTIEISLAKVFDYKVPYSKYVELRKERREQQLASFKNQQKAIQDAEKFVERFRYKASKSIQVQQKIRQLDKIERIEVEEEDKAAIHFKFPPAPRGGAIVVESEKVVKKYGQKLILDSIDFKIERNDKVAFVGKNGEGKTTFSRILVGDLEFDGTVKTGHNINIGYFAQNQDELLDGEKTVFQTLDDRAVGEVRTKLRDILGSFLFSGEDIDKKVKVLSGGEKTRLAIAALLLEPYNLLVLDEPTNHLDMRSKDILKNALKAYNGTLILVSHDRYFLDGLVDKVYEFRNKKVKEYLGGIYDFLQKKKIENLRELERKAPVTKVEKNLSDSASKQKYEERKEAEKEIRKTNTKIQKTEEEIESLELRIQEMDKTLANPNSTPNLNYNELFNEYQEYKKELEKKMRQWEQLNYELEILEEKKAESY